MGINRARLKINGHAYQPWLKFQIEHDFVNSTLLTYAIKLEKYDWLKFKTGQWKFEYSRERSISSGGCGGNSKALLASTEFPTNLEPQ